MAPAMAERYPSARVIGPKSVEARNPKVRVHSAADDVEYRRATPTVYDASASQAHSVRVE